MLRNHRHFWLNFSCLMMIDFMTTTKTHLPKGGGYYPLKDFVFRPAKMLNSTIKWLQLIVGSPILVILGQTILLSYPWVGEG